MVGLSGVWVGLLSFRVVVLPILEGVVLPSTGASVIAVAIEGTGNELLLGEGDKISTLNEVLALQSACGRKCPARSAVALILDRGNSACLDPIDLVSVARFIKNLRLASLGLLRASVAEHF